MKNGCEACGNPAWRGKRWCSPCSPDLPTALDGPALVRIAAHKGVTVYRTRHGELPEPITEWT